MPDLSKTVDIYRPDGREEQLSFSYFTFYEPNEKPYLAGIWDRPGRSFLEEPFDLAYEDGR